MSRGEARAVILARALAAEPRVLLLDEFLDGLDRETERTVLSGLAGPRFRDTAIIIASHRPERTPDFIDKAALMDEGRIIKTGTVQEVAAAFSPPAPEFGRKENRAADNAEFLLRIRNTTVRRNGRDILEGLNLTLHPGEHLAVVGPNGSGKSTLLMLIMAALRPLSGGTVEWFGDSGPRELFAIRRRIGYVSPELQATYRYDVSALEFVLSGLDASVGFYRRARAEETARATELIEMAGLYDFKDRKIRSMSYGQLRRLLVARALAPEPELLLLDEAASGLDPAARAGLMEMLNHAAASGVGIIYATHHEDDLPGCINRVLELGRGKAEIKAL
jgi:molybdate transport system ATP-binding protein